MQRRPGESWYATKFRSADFSTDLTLTDRTLPHQPCFLRPSTGASSAATPYSSLHHDTQARRAPVPLAYSGPCHPKALMELNLDAHTW